MGRLSLLAVVLWSALPLVARAGQTMPATQAAGHPLRLWVTPSASDAPEIDVVMPPNPPEHGWMYPPPVVTVSKDGSLSVSLWSGGWYRRGDFYRTRSVELSTMLGSIKAAPRPPNGEKWVCIAGDPRSRYRRFVVVLRQLRRAGYEKVCLAEA
jgi:biopolymer transport protein ExbD